MIIKVVIAAAACMVVLQSYGVAYLSPDTSSCQTPACACLRPIAMKERRENTVLFWGSELPARDIPFSGNALAQAERYAAKIPSFTGPVVRIYRSVSSEILQRMIGNGFENVPREAVLKRMNESHASFEDDALIHKGRLPCCGQTKGSLDMRRYQGRGTLLAMDMRADILLEEGVLILDRDAIVYLEMTEKGFDVQRRWSVSNPHPRNVFLDEDSPEAKRLMQIVQEISEKNKRRLRELLRDAPGEIPFFLYGKEEIIIPADVLNVVLGSCKELPVHDDTNYITVELQSRMNLLLYIPSFWERVRDKFRIALSKGVRQTSEIWKSDDGRFSLALTVHPNWELEISVADTGLSGGRNDFIILANPPKVYSDTATSTLTICWDRYPQRRECLDAFGEFVRKLGGDMEPDNPLREAMEAILKLAQESANGNVAAGGHVRMNAVATEYDKRQPTLDLKDMAKFPEGSI